MVRKKARTLSFFCFLSLVAKVPRIESFGSQAPKDIFSFLEPLTLHRLLGQSPRRRFAWTPKEIHVYEISKHLKGRLGPVLVTYRFWIKGGQLGPCVSNVTFLDHLPEPSGTFRNFPELSRTFRNLLEPSGTFKNLPEPSRTFRNLLEPSRTFQNLLEPSGTS